MGCGGSKNKVEGIVIRNGKVKSASTKAQRIQVESAGSKEAIISGETKATSAKSRDSGIEEMEYLNEEGIITENSDPNLIKEIENNERPATPDLGINGLSVNGIASQERLRSKIILQELEDQGLIKDSRLNKGGAAFEVSTGPLRRLQPLAPLKLPPPRLQSAAQRKQITKEELERKLQEAEDRRLNSLSAKKRSRLATNLAKATSMDTSFNTGENMDHLQCSEIDSIMLTHPPTNVKHSSSFEDATWQNKVEKISDVKDTPTVI